jgi:hypothetical protein
MSNKALLGKAEGWKAQVLGVRIHFFVASFVANFVDQLLLNSSSFLPTFCNEFCSFSS